MTTRFEMFQRGCEVLRDWCALNKIDPPSIVQLAPTDRLYHLATCAYYRPTTIHIMVNKCANKGHGGRSWSWPGYVIDRTPYGVLQHELGHHVDHYHSERCNYNFAQRIHKASSEPPLTGYLGANKREVTFYAEWFAENFRLFVTNPALCQTLRPAFYNATKEAGYEPLHFLTYGWESTLAVRYKAPARIVEQARKKVLAVTWKLNL